jgi:hypothetical protein
MNLEAVADVMGLLARLYPNYNLTPETIEAYALVLGDVPPDLLRMAAINLAGQAREFFPPAGVIRAAAFELVEQVDSVPSAGEAWGEVCAVWRGRKREELHPLIHRAVEAMGGWKQLGLSENPMADRAHFLKVYDVLLERKRADVRMLPQVKQHVAALAATNGQARVLDGLQAVTAKLTAGNGKTSGR